MKMVFLFLFFFLRDPVAPVCKVKEVTIIGASLEETVRVRCEVEADPSEVEFDWEFNNSGENFEVAPAKYDENNGTMNELIYTPQSERDYGALTCRGRNAIGKQEVPCIYQVIPAGDGLPLKRICHITRRRRREPRERKIYFAEFFIENQNQGSRFSPPSLSPSRCRER